MLGSIPERAASIKHGQHTMIWGQKNKKRRVANFTSLPYRYLSKVVDPNTLNLPIWIGIQVFVINYEIILKKKKIISFKNIFLNYW